MEWLFDGIGTEIISLLIGAIGGGIAGYRIAIHRTAKQRQHAGDHALQRQEWQIDQKENETYHRSTKEKLSVDQVQKAGDHAVQTQIGGINHVER